MPPQGFTRLRGIYYLQSIAMRCKKSQCCRTESMAICKPFAFWCIDISYDICDMFLEIISYGIHGGHGVGTLKYIAVMYQHNRVSPLTYG